MTAEEQGFWIRLRLIGSTVLLWAMLALVAWVVISYVSGRSTSNEDLLYELRYGNCLLANAPEERENPEVVAECQDYAQSKVERLG